MYLKFLNFFWQYRLQSVYDDLESSSNVEMVSDQLTIFYSDLNLIVAVVVICFVDVISPLLLFIVVK